MDWSCSDNFTVFRRSRYVFRTIAPIANPNNTNAAIILARFDSYVLDDVDRVDVMFLLGCVSSMAYV